MLKKLIILTFLTMPMIAFAIPTQPSNGGLGVSNPSNALVTTQGPTTIHQGTILNSTEVLQPTNNLSDVSNVSASRGNIGLPTQALTLDQDQNYVINNPAPGIIYVNMPTSGHVVKMPPIGVPGGLDPSTTIEVVVSNTSEDLIFQDANGDNLLTVSAGKKYLAAPVGQTLAPPTGWYFKAVSSSGEAQDMQSTYNYGSVVNLKSSQPIKFAAGGEVGDVENLMPLYSPSYSGPNANSEVIGMSFYLYEDGAVSSLCYLNDAFASGTRQVGLWQYTTTTIGTLLATADVEKTDPLDTKTGHWRCHAIAPVVLEKDRKYVVAALVPTTDQWLFYQANASSWASLDGTSQMHFESDTLVYPPIQGNLAQSQWGNANLLFGVGSGGGEEVLINDAASNENTVFQVNSTSRGSHPAPSMTKAEWEAVSAPAAGDLAYLSDIKNFGFFDGVSRQTLLSLDDLIAGSNISLLNNGDGTVTVSSTGGDLLGGGSAVFYISSGATTTFSNSSYKPLNMTVAGSTAHNLNVNNDGSVEILDAGTYDFEYVISGRSSGTQNVFAFRIAKNGVTQSGSMQVYDVLPASSSAGNSLVLKYSFALDAGDVIQPYIANLGAPGDAFIAQQLVGKITQDLASSATLQQGYENGNGAIEGDLDVKPFEIKNSSGVALLTSTESAVNITGNASTVTNGVYTTDTGTVTSSMLAGSIPDSKLSTITGSGKVANSATTATSANTASAIVARDGSGNFSAGTITARAANFTNNNSALTGTNYVVSFPFALSFGNYINFQSRGNYGLNGSGEIFQSYNLAWDVAAASYKYINSSQAAVVEFGNSGILIKTAPAGVSGNTVTPVTVARFDASGNIYFPQLAANSLLSLDGSKVAKTIATANNATLVTDGSGAQSFSSTLPNAVQDNITRLGTLTVPVQNSAQPFFSAYMSANASNATGNGVAYTPIFETTSANVGAHYNTSTGVFTAPFTGNYHFDGVIYLAGVASANTTVVGRLVTSGISYPFYSSNGNNARDASSNLAIPFSVTVPLNANDTVSLYIRVDGGTQTVTVKGGTGSNQFSYFSGYLVS